MKNKCFLLVLVVLMLTSCQKELVNISAAVANKNIPPTEISNSFIKYSIAKGAQYCDQNIVQKASYDELRFIVKFDSSAIYQTKRPDNQNDINKLYGFSDNNKQHHEFSARFGWRWSNNALRLFGYIYNNGIMSFQELGTVSIGAEINCSIKVTANAYIFSVNETATDMPRASTTAKAEGYKLFPYFGGDEVAPHAILIWIKEL